MTTASGRIEVDGEGLEWQRESLRSRAKRIFALPSKENRCAPQQRGSLRSAAKRKRIFVFRGKEDRCSPRRSGLIGVGLPARDVVSGSEFGQEWYAGWLFLKGLDTAMQHAIPDERLDVNR